MQEDELDTNEKIRELQEEVWGTKRNPERGLVQRASKDEKDLAPLLGFFRGASWPLKILAPGLAAAAAGGIVYLIRAWLRVG